MTGTNRANLIAFSKWLLVTGWFPLFMLVAAMVPLVNSVFFSLHGGIGWYLLMLCGPGTALKLIYDAFLRKEGRVPLWVCCSYLMVYIVLTFVLAGVAQRTLEKWGGLQFSHHPVWSAMNLPWSYLVSRHPLAM